MPTFGQRCYNSSMSNSYNLYTLLQRMQQEFQESLAKVASVISATESEPSAGTSTDPISSSPPQILRTH